jgi:hypothetical protein
MAASQGSAETKAKRTLKVNQQHSPARNPIPGLKTSLRDRGERASHGGSSPGQKTVSPGQKQHDTNLSLGFIQGRVLALEGQAKDTEMEVKRLEKELEKEQEAGKRRDREIQGLLSKIVKMEEEKTGRDVDKAKLELEDETKKEMVQEKQRLDREIQGLLSKIVKMEEEKTGRDVDKAEDETKEEMAKEKQRLDKTKEEMDKVKEEMSLMKDDGVRREEAMAEKLNNMKIRRKEENEERMKSEAEVKEQLKKLKEEGTERRKTGDEVTMVKQVVQEPKDFLWVGDTKEGDEFVILTDSNGAGVTGDTVKRYVTKDKQRIGRIRVCTAYTLFEVFDKVQSGKMKVDGARVILDVTTNDVRGIRGLPRVTPEEIAGRVGRVVATLKEKGAKGVTVCEIKPMTTMDVTPYSELIRRRCQEKKINWCQTQFEVAHMREDGYHILPSSLKILDATYACAVVGVHVPHPTPAYRKWRHQLQQQEWPHIGERPGLNAWRRREEERTRNQIP